MTSRPDRPAGTSPPVPRHDYDRHPNEYRADVGAIATRAAATAAGLGDRETIETAISDTLAYIAHACDRHEIDPTAMFARALRVYAGDHEDGPPAAPTRKPADLWNDQP